MMSLTKYGLIFLIVLVFAAGVGLISFRSKQANPLSAETAQVPVMQDKEDDSQTMAGDEVMVEAKDESAMMPSKTPGTYEDYAPEKLAKASTGKVILFFHAPWCPTCKILQDDINAHLQDIPENVTILRTDYDTSTELKKKYGITYQHTLVQVDENGNMIKKWSGSPSLAELLSEVQ